MNPTAVPAVHARPSNPRVAPKTPRFWATVNTRDTITLRTGNAWVDAIGYHAITPHVIVDTPMIAKIFRIG